MTDSETVLVADINVRERFHLPNQDNPDEPRCHRKKVVRGGFRKRDRDRLPEKFELCKYCDPEHTIERQGCPEGGTIASKLEDADPDQLVTDGGTDTYAGDTERLRSVAERITETLREDPNLCFRYSVRAGKHPFIRYIDAEWRCLYYEEYGEVHCHTLPERNVQNIIVDNSVDIMVASDAKQWGPSDSTIWTDAVDQEVLSVAE